MAQGGANFAHGFTSPELTDMVNIYRASAGKTTYSSKKMNKAPNAENKQLSFTIGNTFIICAWFISQHNITKLAPVLTPAIIIAFALSTMSYRVDESVITGKNGGQVLDPARAQAYFQLSVATNDTHAKDLVPLVETVLFGSPLNHSTTINAACGVSTSQVARYSLDDAQLMCNAFDDQRTSATTDRSNNRGRFLVIDFLHTAQAREAADTMEAAGLARATHFNSHQLPDACGYLAAGWACELRHLGTQFQEMTHEIAAQVNTAEFIETQNLIRSRTDLGPTAEWLTGDEIQGMVTLNNPDGSGRDPGWLAGPAAMNHWRTHFGRTLVDRRDQDRVHIMIVNTVDATAPLTSTGPMGGEHWFVAAWLVEPKPEGSCSGE